MKSLTFNNQAIEVFRQDDQIWLTSSELARALGYKSTKSITNLYNANADEFTDGMTLVTESMTNGINNSLREITVRIFSLRGCHLIAMFARTAVAKEFRKWVLDILDNFSMRKSTASIFINERQAQIIQSAVNQIKEETGESWQSIYSRIHQKFNVVSYREILRQDFELVMEFLNKSESQPVVKDQELMTFSVALMKLGLWKHLEVENKRDSITSDLLDMADQLRVAAQALNEISRNDGAVYDGLAEALLYLPVDTAIHQAAEKKAKSMQKPLVLDYC